MIEITFLGTGCMQPTKIRNHSGILLSYNKESILMDCGEGTQRQMRIAGIKPARITKILISHWHGDHVFGLPGLLSTMGADKPGTTVQIYGPPGTKSYLDHVFQSFAKKDIIPFTVSEVQEGIIYESEEFTLSAHKLKHSVPCYGYCFQEKDRRRIVVAKAKKLGLEGPILGNIQQGKDVVHKGIKIKVNDVTYLEGTHLSDIQEKTEKYMHLTVQQAALIASENNTQNLIITHLSQRYKSPTEILKEAKTYFDKVAVAEDFMKVKV